MHAARPRHPRHYFAAMHLENTRSYINEEAHLNVTAARTNHHVSKIKVHSLGGSKKVSKMLLKTTISFRKELKQA